MVTMPHQQPQTPRTAGAPVGLILSLITIGVVGSVLLGGTGFWAAWRIGNINPANMWSDPSYVASPPSATDDGIVLVEGSAEQPTLVIYEDFQCPHCHTSHAALSPAITEITDKNLGTVEIRTMTFLDRSRGNNLSTKAAEGAACADTVGAYAAYRDAVFAHQDSLSTTALSTTLAAEAGISGSNLTEFSECLDDGEMADFVQKVNSSAAAGGVNKTPTYTIDGDEVQLVDSDALLAHFR